jgi:formamidopyrimidine-DNA glycosylase
MPELPEVETIKRGLSRVLIGKKINSIKIFSPKQFEGNSKTLIGKKIQSISRRAKILILELSARNKAEFDTKSTRKKSGKLYLLIHLKLSGQLIYTGKKSSAQVINSQGLKETVKKQFVVKGRLSQNCFDKLPNKYTRIIVSFSDGSRLYFNDLRKFGWLKVFDKSELDKFLLELGPEALTLKLTEFQKIITQGKGPTIKQLLMNQEQIAGVGNIYSDEVLYCAKINPFRLVKKVKPSETKILLTCLKKILNTAIKHQGISDNFYRTTTGGLGTFAKVAQVYHRENKPCSRCQNKSSIIRKKLAGRSTHFCSQCQK